MHSDLMKMRDFGLFASSLSAQVRQSGGDSLSVADFQRFMETLGSVFWKNLGSTEQRAILAVVQELKRDGSIDRKDIDVLLNMINDFKHKGDQTADGSWPFRHLYPEKMHGNPLHNKIIGAISAKFGHSASNEAFLSTVNSLLNMANPGGWESVIRNSLNRADLNQLGPADRVELIAMLTNASRNGTITRWEGAALYDTIHKLLKNDDMMPPPPAKPAPSSWASRTYQDGLAVIDLGNYYLRLDEHQSGMELINKETGEKTRVWGNGQFDVDGNGTADMSFRGPISLRLEDGTKITIDTKASQNCGCSGFSHNPSKLTITRGNDSIVVTGLDSNQRGDLTVSQGKSGRLLDKITPDGMTLYENPQDRGWMVQDGWALRPVQANDVGGRDNVLGQQPVYMPNEQFLFNNLNAMQFDVASTDLRGMLQSMFAR